MRRDTCLLQTMTFARLAGGQIHLCTRIGEGKRAWHVKQIHICWRSCRLRQRRGHSATTISDGGGHRQSRATLNETTNYARATRMTVTPNKKWCWFLGQYRRRLSWAADRRHDQNQASPPSGDDELELALVAARD